MEDQQEHNDIFSCLAVDCQSTFPSCNSIKHTQSLIMVCEEILPKLLKDKFIPSIQEEIDSVLAICANSLLAQQEVISAARKLAEILKPFRPCHSHFAYRYPDCKYNAK